MADYEVVEPRFHACFNRTAHVDRLWTGGRWTEGPAYFGGGRYLVFSDIPNNRMMRFDECSGAISVFRQPSEYANGNTVDRQGRLVTCEHGGRRVVRTEHDGRTTVIADNYRGKRLNSPNDVIVRSDGSIWFTDPPYGILSDYEGHKADSELESFNVFRVDGATGEMTIVADDFIRPNGIAFSLDEKRLFIVDSAGGRDPGLPKHIRVFDVDDKGGLSNGRQFADCTSGRFDGMRLDDAGRLWAAADDGVHCLDQNGMLIGRILIPEICSNVCFGGPKRNYLFICAATSLYGVLLPVNGAKTY
jgi:gluconolactonase